MDQPEWLNPEQLLFMAAASCQLLSFLAVAGRAGIDVLSYDDDAVGVVPDDNHPMRITRIVLHPRIVVASGTTVEAVRQLVVVAHRECYVANSLHADVTVQPHIQIESRPQN